MGFKDYIEFSLFSRNQKKPTAEKKKPATEKEKSASEKKSSTSISQLSDSATNSLLKNLGINLEDLIVSGSSGQSVTVQR